MKPIRVFVRCAHADEKWLAEEGYALVPWLQKTLKRSGVEFWWDREKDSMPVSGEGVLLHIRDLVQAEAVSDESGPSQ